MTHDHQERELNSGEKGGNGSAIQEQYRGRIHVTVRAQDPLTRTGLLSYLRAETDVAPCDTADEGEADIVVAAFDKVTPQDVTELHAVTSGWEKPVVLLARAAAEATMALTEVGCRIVAMLPREAATDGGLVGHLRVATHGSSEPDVNTVERLLAQAARLQRKLYDAPRQDGGELSQREIDVLRLAAEGFDTNEIARQLRFSSRTIEKTIRVIIGRLQVRNRPHAVAYAIRRGII